MKINKLNYFLLGLTSFFSIYPTVSKAKEFEEELKEFDASVESSWKAVGDYLRLSVNELKNNEQ